MDSKFFNAVAVFFWLLMLYSFMKDRSRYRNCYLLFLTIVSSLTAITFMAGEYQLQVILVIFIASFTAMLMVPFFLVHNGIQMYKKEGHSLANLLSFVLGLVIGIGEIATFLALFGYGIVGYRDLIDSYGDSVNMVSAIISVSVIYLSLSFLIFMVYCCALQIIPRKRDFDYVIIHGAGLLDGSRVSKLLADRIDKAIEVYRRDPTPPKIIPSGGQGDDEDISEAEAMKEYLIGKGIPEDMIIMEDKSTTTYENLVNSKSIIDSQEGRKYTALVTSNYHVYRALRYCRQIGLRCTGIGSRVAFYYWPSALIREYIAIHAEKKHLFYFIAGWFLCITPVIMLYSYIL